MTTARTYDEKDELRGKLKGELLEGKRYLTALCWQLGRDRGEDLLPIKAMVRRLSINREFGFRYPSATDDLIDEERDTLKLVGSDSRRTLAHLKGACAALATGYLATDGVLVEARPSKGLKKTIPPVLIERPSRHVTVAELRADGWKDPEHWTLGLLDG
jgi:hypothetical protein